tara:strand:- start:2265 stop:3272 length:1008 start_codon:yes stop_codon:yes gene_type:complete
MKIKSYFLQTACGLLSLGPFLAGTSLAEPGELSLPKLKLALKANKNPEKMLEEKEKLATYLKEKLNREVEVIVPTSSAIILEGFANGTIDLGYLSSTDAAKNAEADTASILLIHLKNGKPHYDSVWLSLKEKDYDSIEDLKGKPVAFASPTSTSGFLIPVRDLHEKKLIGVDIGGLEDFFSKTIFGTGYVTAVEKVLSGEAEAAAVSDYVFLGEKYLDEGQKAKLKIVQKQGPVPSHTICYRKSLSDSDRDILKATLLAMNDGDPVLRDKVFNGKLVEVDEEEHLKVTREALAIAEDLEKFRKKNSWPQNLIIILVLLGIALIFFMRRATAKVKS